VKARVLSADCRVEKSSSEEEGRRGRGRPGYKDECSVLSLW
jgi:hypothetical protein